MRRRSVKYLPSPCPCWVCKRAWSRYAIARAVRRRLIRERMEAADA